MRNVFTIIDDLAAGLAELKTALQPLAAFAGGSSTLAERRPRRTRRSRTNGRRRSSTTAKNAAASTRPARRRKAASPKLRAQRVQQGKYLGALRSLTASQRAQVKVAKANGDYGSALNLAASLQKRSA